MFTKIKSKCKKKITVPRITSLIGDTVMIEKLEIRKEESLMVRLRETNKLELQENGNGILRH